MIEEKFKNILFSFRLICTIVADREQKPWRLVYKYRVNIRNITEKNGF